MLVEYILVVKRYKLIIIPHATGYYTNIIAIWTNRWLLNLSLLGLFVSQNCTQKSLLSPQHVQMELTVSSSSADGTDSGTFLSLCPQVRPQP